MTIARRLSLSLAAAAALATAAPAIARPLAAASRTETASSREPARALLKIEVHLQHPSSRRLYVGQAVPITIRAYFLAGTSVSMNGRPRLTSDALQLTELSETPRQSQTELRGLPYTMVAWDGVLTAVRAGATNTDVELPVALSYREAPRARSLDDADQDDAAPESSGDDQNAEDPFADLLRHSPLASDPAFAQMFKGGDPFQGMFRGGDPFRRMFAELSGAVRQRDVTLRGAAGTLDVEALPPNAPAGFTGAVGTFEIAAALGGDPLRVGEPATLTLTARGRGSFSRLSSKGVAPSDELNAYGVASTFTPGPTAITGEKIFKQTIVARKAGSLTLPSTRLTYFDPDERRYISRDTAPMTVSVAAASASGEEQVPAAATASTAEPTSAMSALATPAASHSVPDVTRASLTPVIRTRWFWALAGAVGLASLIVSMIGFLRRKGALGRVATTRRIRREVTTLRRTMSAAADRGDAPALFAAGRAALQARLAALWGVSSEAIAAADVAARLGPRGDRIREVFERADRLAYSRGHAAPPTSEDLTRWQGLITNELRSLEVRS